MEQVLEKTSKIPTLTTTLKDIQSVLSVDLAPKEPGKSWVDTVLRKMPPSESRSDSDEDKEAQTRNSDAVEFPYIPVESRFLLEKIGNELSSFSAKDRQRWVAFYDSHRQK